MRVFWDSMLFIYLLEANPEFVDRVRQIFERHVQRGDELCTSHLAIGEVMMGPRKLGDNDRAEAFCDSILASNIHILPFDLAAAGVYSRVRAAGRVSTPDAIHLACAAAQGVDVFLTNDTDLPKLVVPGIGRIVGLDSNIF